MAWIEKAGIPSVAIQCPGFMSLARATAGFEGVADLRQIAYPYEDVALQSEEEVFRSAELILDSIVEALTSEVGVEATTAVPSAGNRDIVFRGSLEEVNEYFYKKTWTDGLPIVPPTIEKVEEFLKYTERSPDEVLGIFPPSEVRVSVWNVAVNGVMAGCRPQYMPVLIAIVEAFSGLIGPDFAFIGSTYSPSVMVTLNGPIRHELGFNVSTGVLRPGWRANTT
ncbi:MAG: hypothetical protein HY665_05940, partial [Chloroflexi bacterium]|nr:hypothetical protein [Chloroflexota bacterium]